MMKDLFLFVVLLMIFLFGFTFQAAALYVPATAAQPNDPNIIDQDGGLIIRVPLMLFEQFYFAQFGVVDPENLPPVSRCPWWAVQLLKTILGFYMLITFIILVNMLIAMMGDTYDRISEESDTEWKFGRAKLFRNMNERSSSPSPIIIVTKFITYVKILVKHRSTYVSNELL
jgi:Ion transport protein